MSRLLHRTARTLAGIVFGISIAGFTAQAANAQSAVATFNGLTEDSPGSGTRFISNCYSESGFVFTAVGVGCAGVDSENAFVAGGPNSPIFGGGSTPSLLLNSPLASLVNITTLSGGLFSLSSIALAPFFDASTTVLFTGTSAAGTVTQSFDLSGTQLGFQNFLFSSAFTALSSVQISATNEFGEPLVKFDDVAGVLAQAVVPEPSTIMLSAAGIVCILAFGMRRRQS